MWLKVINGRKGKERKKGNARVKGKKPGVCRARRRCSRSRGMNFACAAASDRFIYDSACMKDVLSNALRLA